MLNYVMSRRLLSSSIQSVKVLPPFHVSKCVQDPSENFLQSHVSKKVEEINDPNALCSVVRFLSHSPGDGVAESLNNVILKACQESNGKLFGVASLLTINADHAQAEVEKYSSSEYVKAFDIECTALALKSENYKSWKWLLGNNFKAEKIQNLTPILSPVFSK